MMLLVETALDYYLLFVKRVEALELVVGGSKSALPFIIWLPMHSIGTSALEEVSYRLTVPINVSILSRLPCCWHPPSTRSEMDTT
jgi:hypothetical protein